MSWNRCRAAIFILVVLAAAATAGAQEVGIANASTGITIVGSWSWNKPSGSSNINMTANQISNTRANGTESGTLRLELWATTTYPVFGGTINFYRLGEYPLGQLEGGDHFNNINVTALYTAPPNGTYWVSLVVTEYQSSGEYLYVDIQTDPEPETFGTGGTGCTPGGTALCLNNGRFRVSANWQSPTSSGVGTAISLTSDTGYFWFFNSANVEVVVKVLNGCVPNTRYWVFAAGLTNVNVTLTVQDTQTGTVRTYTNPINTPFQPIQDTAAFATCP